MGLNLSLLVVCFEGIGKKWLKIIFPVFTVLRIYLSQAAVVHACNSSYSGSRNEDDHGSKPARANSPQNPISKKPNQKGLMEWLKGRP
jgi:hypothetical protein